METNLFFVYLKVLDPLIFKIFGVQGKDRTAEERRIAICIFDDLVEHCREAALR